MEFHKFAILVEEQFRNMSSNGSYKLFRVDLSKDQVWDKYLESFPEGTNPVYKERTEHDCQTCRQFINKIGNVIAVDINFNVVSVWDIDKTNPNLVYPYNIVSSLLADYVKSKKIKTVFLMNEKTAGAKTTQQLLENGNVKTWHHFYANIPNKFYMKNGLEKKLGNVQSRYAVHKRSLETITESSIETVIDLINQNVLYRGAEFKSSLENFEKMSKEYKSLNENQQNFYVWLTYNKPGAGIRNTVIGTLLVDLSEGVDVETAVKSFESKVAPANYKRPKAIVTERMVKDAIKTIDSIGLRDSLPRRHAVSSDISINDVIFADRGIAMKDRDPLFDLIGVSDEKISMQQTENAPEIGIEEFIQNIIPLTSELKLAVNESMKPNEVFISAPINPQSPSLFKWDNGFSWSYTGGVADSEISKLVRKMGGKTDGLLRFSIMWNKKNMDNIDLDAHAVESNGDHIYYSHKTSRISRGFLDIDIVNPNNKPAVENIVWNDLNQLYNSRISLYIHRFSGHNLLDVAEAEVVFNGITYKYKVDWGNFKADKAYIANINIDHYGNITIEHLVKPISNSRALKLQKVELLTYSPNYWGENSSGNKHYFFLTDNVKTNERFRGFYNEFLRSDLEKHRKVFEVLASKMMVDPIENGLKGYGFSSTRRNSIVVKADNKLFKIKFN